MPLSRCAALVLLLAACSAQAAERVTLRSGFTVECVRHDAAPGDAVRLYLAAGAPGENYMDVARKEIASIEEFTPPPAVRASTPRNAAEASRADLLSRSGRAHNVNVSLLAAVIQAESAGNAHAVSRAGARGLMQLMPATAAELGVEDSFSPEGNVNGGSTYLDRLLTRYHDNLVLAVAAYNAGPAAVDRYRGVPPFRETRLYVARVVREFNRLALQAARSPATPMAAR